MMPDITEEFDYLNAPLGAVIDPAVAAANRDLLIASGADLSLSAEIAGELKRKMAAGIHYYNQADDELEYLKREAGRIIKGTDGFCPSGILMVMAQQTGICNGCSHRKAAFRSWCSRFVRSGDCPIPRETTFVAPYLMGRAGLRGDSGSYPSYTISGMHKYGVLCVDAPAVPGIGDFRSMTLAQQEAICVRLRDNPILYREWKDAMQPLRTRVFSPPSVEAVGDVLASGYSVTIGTTVQISPPAVGGNGVSGWYRLNGGHETCFCGWFSFEDRIGYIKDESWKWFPADRWPEKRITIMTDDGPKNLYEGQGACWADTCPTGAEYWGVGYPSSLD